MDRKAPLAVQRDTSWYVASSQGCGVSAVSIPGSWIRWRSSQPVIPLAWASFKAVLADPITTNGLSPAFESVRADAA